MEKFQARALSWMAEARVEYNHGVLSALGHKDLYDAWNSALIGMQLATQIVDEARNAAMPKDEPLTFENMFPPVDEALLVRQDAERARVNAAWAPIEKLRQQARDELEAADPMGMGQSV